MIVAVAIRLSNGTVRTLPKPARHHHLFKEYPETSGVDFLDQGFIDEKGTFYRRNAAELHARSCGQITKALHGSILTSEDLW